MYDRSALTWKPSAHRLPSVPSFCRADKLNSEKFSPYLQMRRRSFQSQHRAAVDVD